MQGHNMLGGDFYALSDELVEKMQRASYGEDFSNGDKEDAKDDEKSIVHHLFTE
jgi:hypothetical protein